MKFGMWVGGSGGGGFSGVYGTPLRKLPGIGSSEVARKSAELHAES